MNKNKKTSFKILLNSYVTASYTGTQFNAKYYVNLTDVISNDADFDKSYYVYVTFRSRCAAIATNKLENTDSFYLNIDFNKKSNISQYQQQNKTIKNISYILPVMTTLEKGTTTVNTFFYLKDKDQKPTIINNIRSINFITLNVTQADIRTF